MSDRILKAMGRYPPFAPPMRRSKYRAVPTYVGDIRFDSKAEAKRWAELLLLQKGGYIRALERQVPYALDVNGVHVCNYIADFRYREGAELVCEDVKGHRTREYILKNKLMLACHGVKIREVGA